MNYNNYLYFKNSEKINIDNKVNVNHSKSKMELYLTTTLIKTFKTYDLKENFDYDKVLKAIKCINEYNDKELIIIYGDRNDYNKSIENDKKIKLIHYEDYSIYSYHNNVTNKPYKYINKNNKMITINSLYINYFDYHHQTEFYPGSTLLNHPANFMLINQFDLNNKEYLLAALLYDLNKDDINKIINNINSKLINQLLNLIHNKSWLYNELKTALKELVHNYSFDNLINYDLKTINNILNLDINFKSKDFKKEERNIEKLYSIINSLSIKPFSNKKNNKINVLNSYEKMKRMYENKNYLIYLDKNENNLSLLKTLKDKYLSYKILDDVIIYEFDKSFTKKDLLNYINDYEIYTILDNDILETLVYDLLITSVREWELSRIFLLSKYYNIKLNEYLLNKLILKYDEKYHKLLIDNKDTNLISSLLFIIKIGKMNNKTINKIKTLLDTQKIDFNKYILEE